MLIEVCAGLLDLDQPLECIKKEAQEETGYVLQDVEKVFELYMSPGSVTEILHLFIAEIHDDQREGHGGGVSGEEDIEVLEIPFKKAIMMMSSGEIQDAKTVILLQHLQLRKILEA
jgi:GDP-mannose pyrophosphatase NudK